MCVRAADEDVGLRRVPDEAVLGEPVFTLSASADMLAHTAFSILVMSTLLLRSAQN